MICIVVILLLMYMFWDINYYIRFSLVQCCNLINGKKNVYEKSTLYGICTTNDVGIFWDHMNNARYHREVDFARFAFYLRTGIYDKLKEVNGNHLLGASWVRFRRKIDILSTYKIESQVVYHDEKALYQMHTFITLRDNAVRAVIVTQEVIMGISIKELLCGNPGGLRQLECPGEIKLWLEAAKLSSAKLRNLR